LSFPVTHFDADFRCEEAPYREDCGWMLEHDVAALFGAGGTGEFFSLSPDEVVRVVRAAGRVPVIALYGYGTAAQSAEKAGAFGLAAAALWPMVLGLMSPLARTRSRYFWP
jgi:5-dehydro-4-deoxyglucarate dehydratase